MEHTYAALPSQNPQAAPLLAAGGMVSPLGDDRMSGRITNCPPAKGPPLRGALQSLAPQSRRPFLDLALDLLALRDGVCGRSRPTERSPHWRSSSACQQHPWDAARGHAHGITRCIVLRNALLHSDWGVSLLPALPLKSIAGLQCYCRLYARLGVHGDVPATASISEPEGVHDAIPGPWLH